MASGAGLPFVLRAPIEERGAGGYMCKYFSSTPILTLSTTFHTKNGRALIP